MNDSRIDKFPLILSGIGLLADSITIYVFYQNSQSTSDSSEINPLSIVLLLFIMTYSWFTISWFIAKNSLRKISFDKKGNRKIITKTTFGVGFFLAPLTISLSILSDDYIYLLIHLIIWIVVYSSLRLLITVIYPEFEVFMMEKTILAKLDNSLEYSGQYICKIPYTSPTSKEKFEKGDFIKVFEREHLGDGIVTDKFWYNSKNGIQQKIQHTELDTYWKLEKEEKKTRANTV